ncbi:hypothetical protein G7Y89_g11262 [Cudoniella acicularis]|uniref:Uncharacterized protein n=1 Tax=Cudoniella acicularis TaxID=354080 RepID=A0A8H4RB77_9HELO|nr:hypothetical protein G7Y89_g11262 [Cudoniella acicularis]
MQFSAITVLAAFLATASAAAIEQRQATCTFGQYSCDTNSNGIVQCGYGDNGLQLLEIGACPANTSCGLIGAIPYCLNNCGDVKFPFHESIGPGTTLESDICMLSKEEIQIDYLLEHVGGTTEFATRG